MNEHSRGALQEYYQQASTWNQDRVQSSRRSQKVAWYIAAAAVLVAVIQPLAISMLMPTTQAEPRTLLVDRTTGYVQAIDPVAPSRITPDAALTQSFLVQYVTARESFDLATLQANYRKVALFSGEAVRKRYFAAMQASNPQSPLNIYPRSTVVETHIKSVSPSEPNTAFVRFDTVRTDVNGQVQAPMPWVAVIKYEYTGEPLRLEDRFVNPLSFRVSHYRRDPEALPVAATVPLSPMTSAARPQVASSLPTAASAPATQSSPYYETGRR
jgi:type IV secretion system protein VirB8